MAKQPRQQPKREIQDQILLSSRRRCCICYGLKRDDNAKLGQIAHLNQDRSHSDFDDLAWMCLEHHTLYDSKTSQHKNFTVNEVKAYRDELYERFSSWQQNASRDNLLNFIASTITLDQMSDAAVEAAKQLFYWASHAVDVLTTKMVKYSDGDLYIPHLFALDMYASWGWLTFTEKKTATPEGYDLVHIEVELKPICLEVASRVMERIADGVYDETRSQAQCFFAHLRQNSEYWEGHDILQLQGWQHLEPKVREFEKRLDQKMNGDTDKTKNNIELSNGLSE